MRPGDLAKITGIDSKEVSKIINNLKKKGKISPQKAASKLATLCPCGIFNQERAEKLLEMEGKRKP